MDMAKVIDETKAKLGVESDYALAKQLGIPNPRISEYRSGKARPDAYACARFAEALGVDPFELLAQVEAATEKNEARRTYWKQVAERMAAGSVAAFFVIGLMPGEAQKAGDCNVPNPVIFRRRNTRSEKLMLVCLAVIQQFRNWYAQGTRQTNHRIGRHAPGLIHVTA